MPKKKATKAAAKTGGKKKAANAAKKAPRAGAKKTRVAATRTSNEQILAAIQQVAGQVATVRKQMAALYAIVDQRTDRDDAERDEEVDEEEAAGFSGMV